MGFDFKKLWGDVHKNPLTAIINPIAAPTVLASIIKDKKPNLFSDLFKGSGGNKGGSTAKVDEQGLPIKPNDNKMFYIIAGVVVVIIFIVILIKRNN